MNHRIDPRIDPEGTRLPIKLDTTSNGEFAPVAAVAGEPRREPPRARSGDAQREAARPRPPRVPRLGLRRGEHAARVQRRERRGRPARRLFRARARGRARAAARRRDGRRGRVHLRRAGPLRRPDRRVAAKTLRRGRVQVVAEGGLRARRAARRAQPPALPRAGGVRQGRLPRQRHRHDGAVLRALDARCRAADDPGGRRGAPDRRPHGGHAPPADPRPRQPEPAGRPRGDGRARGALGRERVEDLHAVGSRRQGLLPLGRRRASASSRRRARSASR